MKFSTESRCRSRKARVCLTGVVGAGLLALALAGCSSASDATQSLLPVDDFAGVPKDTQAPANVKAGDDYTVWTTDGKQIVIVLFGSSSCPRKATKMIVPDGFLESTVTVEKANETKPCTADVTPHTTVFDAPDFFRKNDSDIMVGLPSGKVVLSHGGAN